MTHDLIISIVEQTGYKISKVEINDVEKETYFATIFLEDKDGNELNTITFNNVDSRRLSFSKKYVSFHSYEMPETYLATKIASYKFKLFGSSTSNAKADPVEIDVEVKLGSLSAGNSLTSLSGGALKMGSQPVTLDVECEVEATSKGATVSNVNAYASSYVFES